ncbi:hypothetical protein BDZ97DRAFT_1815512 [Flammula alnicola]|nr:hypothetical protein BDZ97DRAFT_1815512 [Flammula alnicola]
MGPRDYVATMDDHERQDVVASEQVAPEDNSNLLIRLPDMNDVLPEADLPPTTFKTNAHNASNPVASLGEFAGAAGDRLDDQPQFAPTAECQMAVNPIPIDKHNRKSLRVPHASGRICNRRKDKTHDPYMHTPIMQHRGSNPSTEEGITDKHSEFDRLRGAVTIYRSDAIVVEPAKLRTTPGQKYVSAMPS